jgi:hypothetical protein
MKNIDDGMKTQNNARSKPDASAGYKQPREVLRPGWTVFGPPEYPGADVPVGPHDSSERGHVGQISEGSGHHPVFILPCALSADPDKR